VCSSDLEKTGLATDNVFASQAFIRSEFSSGGR
jgi:hypothetical protein